ncbi:MAG: hypothetical protein AB8H79_07680, partial [Myxococcota bacterium]
MTRALLLLLLAACTADPKVDPASVRAAAVNLDVFLDRAVDEHDKGHVELSRSAWRDAHNTWDTVLAPGLKPHVERQTLLGLELHLGRIRAEIEDPAGKPAVEVAALDAALAQPLALLAGQNT